MRPWTNNGPACLAAGLVVGLVIGLNIEGLWPSVPLHASATHGIDKFAIATGLVDNSVEALYFLDFLTGDMRAAVINPKTGKFNSFYTRNIAADFGGAGRSSGYLMVTGSADMPRGTNNFQYRQEHCLRGRSQHRQVAAYTIPWNSTLHAAGRPSTANFSRSTCSSSAPRSSATSRSRKPVMSSRMNIQVNGQVATKSPTAHRCRSCCASSDVTQPHVAVELNLEVVPRAQHGDTVLRDGDRLEVVTLVGGG